VATAGDVIENPITGERIVFLHTSADTQGELLQLELTAPPEGAAAALHLHPEQEERLEVLSGAIELKIKKEQRTLRAGEQFAVPKRTPHTWWNEGSEEARVRIELRPARRTETFLETAFGLARDGKTNQYGTPGVLQRAVLLNHYKSIYLTGVPVGLQAFGTLPLALLGRLLRRRAWYPKYSANPPKK